MTAPIASGWSESPGGPCTHWKAPPFHGARRFQTFTGRQRKPHSRTAHVIDSRASRIAVLAHPPIYGLGDLGFVPRDEAAERNIAPGGRLPLNTNGGGLTYSIPACTHRRSAYARCAAPPRPDPRRQDLGLPRCRRHIMSNEAAKGGTPL
jgi:hypothetical protein